MIRILEALSQESGAKMSNTSWLLALSPIKVRIRWPT